jgi:hypothetical protein
MVNRNDLYTKATGVDADVAEKPVEKNQHSGGIRIIRKNLDQPCVVVILAA